MNDLQKLLQKTKREWDSYSPEKQRELEEILKEIDATREENPLQFFEPYPKQDTLLRAQTPVKAFFGGNQTGKTTIGLADDLIQCVDRGILPDHLKPAKRWEPPFAMWFVNPGDDSLVLYTYPKIRELVPKHQLLGGSWAEAFDKQHRVLRFQNGSWIAFKTFSQDISTFGGATLHRVHHDEEPPREIRNECRIRLVATEGDELFTMTPVQGITWMFDGIYERREEDDITVVTAGMDDNPYLSERGKEQVLESLTPEEREARKNGRFVHFSGLVLKGFDSDRHVIDVKPEQIKGQDIVIGIDPGIARGAVVWCAFDSRDGMTVFDELYPSNLDIPTIAELIGERNQAWDIEPDYYVIDPSGARLAVAGQGVEQAFVDAGIYPTRAKNAREASILQLRRRLWADPPALRVDRGCTNWLTEAARWRVKEDEESGQDRHMGDSFKTVGPDHLMDATRYVAMERTFGPIPKTRPHSGYNGQRVHTDRILPLKRPRREPTPPTGAFT